MTVRLSRLERFHGSDQSGNYRLKVPKISTSDFSAVLDCVANGIVVLRDRFKTHQEHAFAELREKHATEMKQIKAEHVTETQAAIEASFSRNALGLPASLVNRTSLAADGRAILVVTTVTMASRAANDLQIMTFSSEAVTS